MKKLTPTAKRKITEDWNRRFPEMGFYKPLHLLRRVGPLLIGILLERDSTNDCYLPTFHVHNLGNIFPVITLTLSEPLRTETTQAPDKIKVSQHASRFKEACKQLSYQAPLPLEGNVQLSAVIRAYKASFGKPTTHYQVELLEDTIMISSWCRDEERAVALLSEAKEVLFSWPKDILDSIGGLEAWYSRCWRLIEKPRLTEKTVGEEIKRLGLEKIPVSKLITDVR